MSRLDQMQLMKIRIMFCRSIYSGITLTYSRINSTSKFTCADFFESEGLILFPWQQPISQSN